MGTIERAVTAPKEGKPLVRQHQALTNRGGNESQGDSKTTKRSTKSYVSGGNTATPCGRRNLDGLASGHGTSGQRIRIGTMDLRIASIALVEGATVLSANASDFEKVPGLTIDDWTR